PMLERIGSLEQQIPVPIPHPEKQAALTTASTKPLRLASLAPRARVLADPATTRINPLAYADTSTATSAESVSDRADRIFSNVTLSLKSIERSQIEKMQGLAIDAYE